MYLSRWTVLWEDKMIIFFRLQLIILKSLSQAMRDVGDCSVSDDDIHYHLDIVALYDRHLCRWDRNSIGEIDHWRYPFSNEKDTADREESTGKHPSSTRRPFHRCSAFEESIRGPWSLAFPSETKPNRCKRSQIGTNLKFMEIFGLDRCRWAEIKQTQRTIILTVENILWFTVPMPNTIHL